MNVWWNVSLIHFNVIKFLNLPVGNNIKKNFHQLSLLWCFLIISYLLLYAWKETPLTSNEKYPQNRVQSLNAECEPCSNDHVLIDEVDLAAAIEDGEEHRYGTHLHKKTSFRLGKGAHGGDYCSLWSARKNMGIYAIFVVWWFVVYLCTIHIYIEPPCTFIHMWLMHIVVCPFPVHCPCLWHGQFVWH